MTKAEIKAIFEATFKSKNIMTPDVMEYGESPCGNYLYELSKGTGLRNEPIYGVTVITPTDEDPEIFKSARDLCGMFMTIKEARERISNL